MKNSIRKIFLRLPKFLVISIFLILTILKIYLVVFTSPVMGYASNSDFNRQSWCTGIWMSYPDRSKTDGHWHQFIDSLKYDGEKSDDYCLRSSGNIFSSAAAILHKGKDSFKFAEISVLYVIALYLCVFILLSYSNSNIFSSAVGISFFLIYGDLANILYINTLYLESSVILGIFVCLLFVAACISDNHFPKKLFWIFSITSMIFLGLVKQQYMPLSIFFLLLLSLCAFYKWSAKKTGLTLIMVAFFVPILYTAMNHHYLSDKSSISMANKTNTFMEAVLPAASNLEDALALLGLPERCREGVGANWYSEKLKNGLICPEVANTSRIKLLRLFLQQPETLITPMKKGLLYLPPFYPEHLEHVAQSSDKESWKYHFVKSTSPSILLSAFAKSFSGIFLYLFAFISIATPILFLLSFKKSLPHSCKCILSIAGMGVMVMFYSIFSSVFGDGYFEISKHAVGFIVGFSFFLTAIIIAVIYALLRLLHNIPMGTTFGARE